MDEIRILHVKRIHEGLKQISLFQHGHENTFSPTFEAWNERVMHSLGEIFGKDHSYTKRFSHLDFCEPRISVGELRWTLQDQKRFETDLSVAEQVLNEALEELEITPPIDKPPQEMAKEGIPVFPNIMPSSIKIGEFRALEKGDIHTEEDLQSLILLLFHEPECDFYYFVEHGNAADPLLLSANGRGDILMSETDFFYYRHPKFDRDYVNIERRNGNYKWDWEREVVEKGPMFTRTKLQLSARKRTELEIWQKIEMEEAFKEHRKKILYSYDVFLSYASEDCSEARGLYEAILAAGGKAFLAEKCIRPGEDFAEEIRIALYGSRELWLLISPNSMKSEWVISEWGAGWVLKKKIIPILHRCSPESLPDRLKRRHCIDYYKFPELIQSTFSVDSGIESNPSDKK
jgi:hypothetical protein